MEIGMRVLHSRTAVNLQDRRVLAPWIEIRRRDQPTCTSVPSNEVSITSRVRASRTSVRKKRFRSVRFLALPSPP